MMYQLTLSDEQIRVLLRALDLYARVGCGQFEQILELFQGDSRRREDGMIQWETLFRIFRNGLLSLQADMAHYAICSPKVPADYRLAWDIFQVVRHHIAWAVQPEGGHLVKFDTPICTSGVSLCTVVTTCDEKIETDLE